MEWTLQTQLSDLATRIAPEALVKFPPRKRAWGMPGAQCTCSLVCEVVVQNAHEYSQRSHRKSPGIPARNGFTAYVVISPAIGFLATVARENLFSRT